MATRHDHPHCLIVTGGSGLIGSRLIERFAPRYQVFSLDVEEPGERLPERARFVEIDLTSDGSVRDAIGEVDREREGPVASILHLAAYYDFAGEPSPLYDEVTVRGTERLLREIRRLPVEQFVFSSTLLVHAPTEPGRPIDEEHPLEGEWDYPRSKIETERRICEQRGDVPAVLLRLAGAYTDTCDSIPIANQIQRIHERRITSRLYPGDLAHGQAFVHLDDVVEAFARTVERRDDLGPDCLPILIGEPETYGYGRLQKELARLIHGEEDWTTEQIPKSVAKTGAWVQNKVPGIEEPFIKPWMIDLADDHYEIDVGRAEKLLGWTPRRRLIDTLPRMVEALARDPEGWYEQHGLEVPAAVAS